jgi:hypothetical protein
VRLYIHGNWPDAKTILEECREAWPQDKPASVLYDYMAGHNFTAPADWEQYRKLTSKS